MRKSIDEPFLDRRTARRRFRVRRVALFVFAFGDRFPQVGFADFFGKIDSARRRFVLQGQRNEILIDEGKPKSSGVTF